MTDKQIEEEIHSKNLNAPRLTPEIIESKIKKLKNLQIDLLVKYCLEEL